MNDRPRCLKEVLERVARGASTVADAEFLRAAFISSSRQVEALQAQLAALKGQHFGHRTLQ